MQVVQPGPPTLADPIELRLAASHILIAWHGASLAPESVTRETDAAEALSRELHDKATAGADFTELAKAYSDGPSGSRGGSLGVWQTGTMVPNFERCTAAVAPGVIAPLCKTPFGWHIIRREAVIEAKARHIVVRFAGTWRATTTRSRTSAQERIQQAQAALGAGKPFELVAAEYSDDTTAATGGDLGLVAPGQMIPAFEDALFALKPGTVSDIVETPYGLHLIQRL
jgi:peptidyl-prolyl cis-trans isomerase SurA